jgi:hypothetical protein
MKKSLNLVAVKRIKKRRKARKILMRSLLTSLSLSKATRMTRIWRA